MKNQDLLIFISFICLFLYVSIFGYDFNNQNFFLGTILSKKIYQLLLLGIVIFIFGKKIIDNSSELK